MPRHPVRFGVQTGQQNVDWKTLVEVWRQADEWGYDSLWNFDHFYPIFTNPEGPCMEAWTTLSALAQVTSRARIGTLVNGNTYRHPSLTAKMAATLDHISGGRFNLGIGAGWFELEHRQLGFDFKTVAGRLEALDESLRIIRGLLTRDRTTVRGRHYHVEDALGLPKPVQKPHPPIMIGGTGRRVLLRLVAIHADMWNASAGVAGMAELIDVLRRHGDEVRRDVDVIEKSVLMPLCYRGARDQEDLICQLFAPLRNTTPEEVRKDIMVGGKQECLDRIGRFVAVGVTHFIFMLFTPYQLDQVEAFADEVIPAARRIG